MTWLIYSIYTNRIILYWSFICYKQLTNSSLIFSPRWIQMLFFIWKSQEAREFRSKVCRASIMCVYSGMNFQSLYTHKAPIFIVLTQHGVTACWVHFWQDEAHAFDWNASHIFLYYPQLHIIWTLLLLALQGIITRNKGKNYCKA